jgi:hypothetical protein
MFRTNAIRNLYSSAMTIYDGGNVLDSNNKKIEIDEAKIQTEINRLQAEYDAQEYARNRKEEYPQIADQLDYMYHNGFEKWKTDMIDPVKDKYPKG